MNTPIKYYKNVRLHVMVISFLQSTVGVTGMWLEIVDNKQLCYTTDLTNCRFCILTVQFRNGKLSYDIAMADMLCFV